MSMSICSTVAPAPAASTTEGLRLQGFHCDVPRWFLRGDLHLFLRQGFHLMLSPEGFQRKLGPGLPLWLNMLALLQENHPKVTFEVHMTISRFWKWAVGHDFLAKSNRIWRKCRHFLYPQCQGRTSWRSVLAQPNGPAVACQTKSITVLARSSLADDFYHHVNLVPEQKCGTEAPKL